MSIIVALGQPAFALSRLRRPAGLGGFHIEEDAAQHASAAAPAPAAAPTSLHGLLALQEADADAVQDRAAQRHAGSMLAELSAIQRALLQDNPAGTSAALARLSGLTRDGTAALDPRLAAVIRAITMRAAVEAPRRQYPEAPR